MQLEKGPSCGVALVACGEFSLLLQSMVFFLQGFLKQIYKIGCVWRSLYQQ